jgi:hypothetical protein
MANVLNRTTKEFKRSVNEPDYPQVDWIWSPDLSGVAGVSSKYWVITGDVVTEMDQASKDAIDLADEISELDAISDRLDNQKDIMRAFALLVMDEFNILRAEHGLAPRTLAQLKTGLRNKLGT